MRHYGYVRYYESVLDALSARGHDVIVAAEQREMGESFNPSRLQARFPGVTWLQSPEPAPHVWAVLARLVRGWLDFLRFSGPTYDEAPKYRMRVEEKMPHALVRVARWQQRALAFLNSSFARLLRGIEGVVPSNAALNAFLVEQQPDVVLLTPLVYLGSSQVDILKSAKQLGLRTGLCVASWDHLSSKSFIRELPDRVFVWNATQQREAETLHAVPPSRVVVTGAQCFDQWFDRQPRRTRAELLTEVGLPPARPFLLYVCSALLVNSPPESQLVESWIRHVRSSDDVRLREMSILIRPHPARTREWSDIEWDFENVAIWGSNPIEAAGKDDYFDSLYHASAVVGINTSAFLEAAVLGKPILTIVLPEFQDNQEGTLHFRYLTEENGGVLRVARTWSEHATQLGQVIGSDAAARARHDAFITSFIRPDRDHTSTETFVAGVEALSRIPRPVATSSSTVGRIALYPLALAARAAFEDALLQIDRGVRLERARRLKAERLAELRREKAKLQQRSLAEYEARVRQRQAARRARAAEQERVRRDQERLHAARRRDKELNKQARWAEKRRRDRQMLRARILQRLKERVQALWGRQDAL